MTKDSDIIRQMAEQHAAAWSAQDPDATMALYDATDCAITVNDATTQEGYEAIRQSAAALMATFPDVRVIVNDTRYADHRAIFCWTLEGHHVETRNFVSLPGWHEWELTPEFKVRRVRGFYEVVEMERQIGKSHA